MSLFSRTILRTKSIAKKAAHGLKSYIGTNHEQWQDKAKEIVTSAKEASKEASQAAERTAKNIYDDFRYSKREVADLQIRIENQGGFYRELGRNARTWDTMMIGGESLAVLLASGAIPADIEAAYQAAYPVMSQDFSFADRVRDLGDHSLPGLLSGVRGKLFEQKYVDYLNDGNLAEGYTARLADSVGQPGWDIRIEGPNSEITEVLQAKATDSVSYVTDAIKRYPNIDVVTTDEVYSHFVMSGVSENIGNGTISNAALADQMENAVDAAELTMDFTPPMFTLAFIAFTSYKNESLTLYEKARTAGDRSGKAYLCYLIGGGIAAVTNIWWLGVLGSVSSRYMSDQGVKKRKIVERLRKTCEVNQRVIDRMKGQPIPSYAG